ncbi:MAG: Uma2 family endonuclease [Anaerolineae bacterium]|nr:Uma2 family endonuclease [Anaerolineae bacterium]
MVIADRTFTEEEFVQFVLLPEHGDISFELIGERAYSTVSNNRSSRIAASIGILIGSFVKQNNLGYVTGADGGYEVSGQRYIPDVAFMSKTRQPNPSNETYNSQAPDLAVEVLSPTDDPANVRIKLTNYLYAGTTVWIVDPDAATVEIYVPNKSAIRLSKDDTISGLSVLPSFQVPVTDIFD